MNLLKLFLFVASTIITSSYVFSQCLNESFSNIGPYVGYQTETWTGDDGYIFTATDARTDQTINGKAITIRNGSLTVNNVSGGIGDLTITTIRSYSGGSDNLNVFVNGTPVGVIPYGATVQTTTLTGINTPGTINLVIQTPGSTDRVTLDDLSWTCYSTSNTISTNTVSSTNFTVDCTTSATGTVDFSSSNTFASGNVFTAELSDASGSFASPTVIGSFAASGVDPTGTISFTIPADFISGTGYRTRVIADNPTTYGTNNGIDISINNTSPCTPTSPTSGGLLINEFSNGPSGNKEYYEFIVAGKCGDVIDVSGYIIDDNNGTFSNPSTYPGGSGIASGYLQLTNHSQWTAIPVGSVIMVFNANDRNPLIPVDDPYDSNNDSLYVIPHNNASLFTIRNDIPNASPPDSSYFPTTSSSTVWSPLGIANAGDAVQVRQPNGNYFFGVSYGNSNITGGPDNTKISNSNLGGKNGYFSNGDFRDIANWSIGNAGTDETPGTYNNALNEAWLRAMRDPNTATCPVTPLPIELLTFEGVYKDNQVNLYWESATELNNDFYSVNHSTDGFNFAEIGIKQGAGTTSSTRTYDMIHRHPSSGINYYQLISSDFNGTQYDKGIISVLVDQDRIFYDQLTQQILFPENGNYTMYSSSGQKIAELKNQSQYPFSIAGIYHIYNHKTGIVTKIAIQ